MTKLTLSMDEAVVATAKKIAEANHTSVSAMVTQFIQSMVAPEKRRLKIGPLTRKATGLVKLPPDKDYKELLSDALAERYGMP
ncbi:MAG: DUF6364 family protein [Phycisphaerae bacterium]|nr:DUF6364 family protein [Phycisphaerae bacterium]